MSESGCYALAKTTSKAGKGAGVFPLSWPSLFPFHSRRLTWHAPFSGTWEPRIAPRPFGTAFRKVGL